ncbi:MAG: pyruvate dehydrogenase complex dihydrolipoamide acetyltransferase [Chthoniobacteraceae bacterium]
MPVYIEMPKLSDTMTEGTLLRWRKKKGETVAAGDILAEVETDKATMEMEAFDDGILAEVYVQDGGKATVGQKLALLLAPGEKAPEGGAPAAPAPAAKPAEGQAAAPAAATGAPAPKSPQPSANTAPASGARVKASPLAKKIAASKGIDLSKITGTGPGSRIVSRDLETASAAAPKTAAPAGVPPMPAGPNDQRIPLSGMRKIIADRLLLSKTTIPHFYLNIEVDAGELMKLRSEVNATAEKSGQPKLTVNDFILKAAVVAAIKVPKVNAAFDGDAVIEYGSINLAVAVAIDDGLVTPVIRDAQKKSLREINAAVKDLATRARSKKLKPDEYQGGTLTVSNLGSYGIDNFSAIINPPQSIILSVGAVVKKPVVNARNEIVAGQRLSIGLSCDHRVVDGAIGAEYLAELRKLIENPALMLI